MCCVGQPAAPPQTNLAARAMPTASNNQFQPRQRLPTIPRTATTQPRFTRPTSATPRALGVAARPRTPAGTRSATPVAPGVAARPRTPTGTRPTRPPTGIARPTVVQNVVISPEPAAFCGANTLPVPRSTMAPSRIAAIMMRRQYSSDRVRTISACLKPTKFNIIPLLLTSVTSVNSYFVVPAIELQPAFVMWT